VIMEQKLLQTTNNLVLDVKECAGCGICVEACPEEAITFGLVGAAKRGAIDEPMWLGKEELLNWQPHADVAKPYPVRTVAEPGRSPDA